MLKVIKCPSCAAPIELDGDQFERCDFCGSSIAVTANNVIPETTAGYQNIVAQAHKLKEILRLARSGQKIEAIKLYRETFGTGLAESKDAVDRLERGQVVSFQNFSAIKIDKRAVKAVSGIGIAIIAVTVLGVLIVLAAVLGALYFSLGRAEFTSSPVETNPTVRGKSEPTGAAFAKEILRFGGEGTGVGKFKDNRVIAVDGEGRIYSADYMGGRVQVFDKDGKFLNQWSVQDSASAIYSLAASRTGVVYVTQRGEKILAYEGSSGKLLKEAKIAIDSEIAVMADGRIVGGNRNSVMIIDDSLKVVKTFKDVAQDAGIQGGFQYLAVNALGEIFAASRWGKDICKISPEGKIVDRFKIKQTSINDIAVDPSGRIAVVETSEIFIYSPAGEAIDSFKTNQTFGVEFNDAGELVAAARPFVVKFALQSP